ncbi:MAG: hypothetical protein ACPL4H_03445 [Anaerolineales bacterium]
MNNLTPQNLVLAIIVTFFSLGSFSIIAGIVILITRTTSKEIKAIATQTNRLIQKGIAEEVAGLVGQASTLLNSLNELIHTTAGVGVTLIIFGIVLNCLAAFIAFQLLR